MAIQCDIWLNAENFKQERDSLIAQTRAELQRMSPDPVRITPELGEMPDIPEVPDQTVTITPELGELPELPEIPDQTVTITPELGEMPDIPEAPDPDPISVAVVTETTELARLQAEISELERVEVEAAVKAVDDDIALLQSELDSITGKDIRLTTIADQQQADKLRACIAALKDKRVTITAETVGSDKLNALRQKLAGVGSAGERAGSTLGAKLGTNLGEQLGKGASAIGAIGSVAGAAVPQVGALAAVVSALSSPIAAITAALSALAAIGMAVWDKMTTSAAEFGESARQAAEDANRQLEKNRQLSAAAREYTDRLRELNTSEQTGITAKMQSAEIIRQLQRDYANLNVEIDSQTGKVKNLSAVEAQLDAIRKKKLAAGNMGVAESETDAAKAAFMKTRSTFMIRSEKTAGKEFDALLNTRGLDNLEADMRAKAQNANSEKEKTGYREVAEKLRAAIEARDRARMANATGYETREEADKARLAEQQRIGSARQDAKNAQKSYTDTVRTGQHAQSDYEFANAKSLSAKKANRQLRIDEEKANISDLEQKLWKSRADQHTARNNKDPEAEANAGKREAELMTEIEESKQRIAGFERQINELTDARQEALRNLTDSVKFELEYSRLIAAGEKDKAAALQLEKELREKNLQLSEKEKQEILSQRKALADFKQAEADKKFGKGLLDQAQTLHEQALAASGSGAQAAEDKALREARKTKGSDLTDAESDAVRQITKLQRELTGIQSSGKIATGEIRTNALTARGGFAGGAVMPDSERINRAIEQHNAKLVDLTRQTGETLKQIKEKLTI